MAEDYLLATPAIDSDSEDVQNFVARNSGESSSQTEVTVKLYTAVRDAIRYDPYRLDISLEGMKASTTLQNGFGWCIPKAVLLAACCRAVKIPARLGFGDVKNHLSTARLRERMQTDVFYWHGYTEIFLEGRWVKATPAFNLELCDRFGIQVLEFDGVNDSLFQPYDLSGNRHLEYIRERGVYADLPLAEIRSTFMQYYGQLLEHGQGDFLEEAAGERSEQEKGRG